MQFVDQVTTAAFANKAWKATKYLSPKLVVKATQRLCRNRPPRERDNLDFVVTIGRPNFADRKYIKALIKAGEPFPVKKIRLQFPPVKRTAKKGKSLRSVRSKAARVLGETRARER